MTGVEVLSAPGYPNTACTTAVLTMPMATGGGLPASELSYGIPSGISSTTLDDGNTMTALTGSVINITFQPNGTTTWGTSRWAMAASNNSPPLG